MNILFVTATPPYPPNTGDRQRTNLILRALQSQGSVDTLLLQPEDRLSAEQRRRLVTDFGIVSWLPPSTETPRRRLRRIAPRLAAGIAHLRTDPAVEYEPRPDAADLLDSLLTENEYQVVIGRYLRPTAQAGAFRYQPLLIDVDDLDTAVLRSMLAAPTVSVAQKLLTRRTLARLREVVPDLISIAERVWVPNENDLATIGRTRASILPNIPFHLPIEGWARPPESGNGPVVLLVASFLYRVNVRNVDRFISRIWPKIHRAEPSARLHVVGTGMKSDQRNRWGGISGVFPLGFVEDLGQAYEEAAFAVAPIFEGGGTNIKVLESLAHGRACVVTPHAHSGFESTLRPGEHILVADESSLAESCLRLLRNHELRDRLALAGHEVVTRHFTFERFKQVVAADLAQIIQEFPNGVKRRSGTG